MGSAACVGISGAVLGSFAEVGCWASRVWLVGRYGVALRGWFCQRRGSRLLLLAFCEN